MKKDLAYYRGLPYRLEVSRFVEDEDGEVYHCASYPRLPQVSGVHRERATAIKLAKELFDSYIEAQLHWSEDIPEPESRRYREPGGRFTFKLVTGTGGPQREIKIPPVKVRSPGPVVSPEEARSSTTEYAGSA